MIVRRIDASKGSQMLTRNFTVFNTSWFDLVLLSTNGTDNVVGATRTFSISADDSVTLTEEVCSSPVVIGLKDCFHRLMLDRH